MYQKKQWTTGWRGCHKSVLDTTSRTYSMQTIQAYFTELNRSLVVKRDTCKGGKRACDSAGGLQCNWRKVKATCDREIDKIWSISKIQDGESVSEEVCEWRKCEWRHLFSQIGSARSTTQWRWMAGRFFSWSTTAVCIRRYNWASKLGKTINVLNSALWFRYDLDIVQPLTIRKCFRRWGIRDQRQEDGENQLDEEETQYTYLLDGMTVAESSEFDASVEKTFTAEDKWKDHIMTRAGG